MSVQNILERFKADVEALAARAHADLEAFLGHSVKVAEADAPKVEQAVEQVAVSLEADAGKDLTAAAAEEKKEG